jgi:hypothetical protein
MELKKSPKIPKKYNCIFCDYHTSNKKDFQKHILTPKHEKFANGNILEIPGNEKIPTLECECSKTFNTHSGLWKHKQKCFLYENKSCNNINNSNTNILYKEKDANDVSVLTNLVLEVVKQNQELIYQNNESQKYNQELQKHVIELCKNGTNNTTITNNNSNNKTFNLNVFLNETCKDAMNITDFVDSLKLQLSDLEIVGKLGFVEGISSIIVKNLNALDVHKRPVHCSDSKREVMYIKDEDKWEKENEEKKRLRKVIKRVADKNARLLPEFKKVHPDYNKASSKFSDQYNKLIIEAMGGSGNEDFDNENKIIRKIAKEVVIDKNDSVIF